MQKPALYHFDSVLVVKCGPVSDNERSIWHPQIWPVWSVKFTQQNFLKFFKSLLANSLLFYRPWKGGTQPNIFYTSQVCTLVLSLSLLLNELLTPLPPGLSSWLEARDGHSKPGLIGSRGPPLLFLHLDHRVDQGPQEVRRSRVSNVRVWSSQQGSQTTG